MVCHENVTRRSGTISYSCFSIIKEEDPKDQFSELLSCARNEAFINTTEQRYQHCEEPWIHGGQSQQTCLENIQNDERTTSTFSLNQG